MSEIVYHVVQHDGGWAYRVGDTLSETFPTHEAAHRAAERAAAEQQRPGADAGIVYEDSRGRWHEELASGGDRPETSVDD